MLEGLECFWNVAVVAELPCYEQFFDELVPRKVVRREHGESGGLEVVPRVEQKTPVFVTCKKGGFTQLVVCRFLRWNIQNELQMVTVYAEASSRWMRAYSYSEIDVIFIISSRVRPALISAFA